VGNAVASREEVPVKCCHACPPGDSLASHVEVIPKATEKWCGEHCNRERVKADRVISRAQ